MGIYNFYVALIFSALFTAQASSEISTPLRSQMSLEAFLLEGNETPRILRTALA